MNSAELFRRALLTDAEAADWSPSTMTVTARGPCALSGCTCGQTAAVVLTIGGREAAFTSADQADALADAVAQCRAELWGPRAGKGGGG